MINNKYVVELELDDTLINFLVELGKKWITPDWINAPAPVALGFTDRNILKVDEHEILNEFRKRHPNLKPFIKLMKFEAGNIPAHIDAQRDCTLNIPVHNCNSGTKTRFFKNYKPVEEKWLDSFGDFGPKLWHSNEYITYIEGGEIDYEFSLTRPALMDTHTAHDIVNLTDDYRLIWSWTYDGSFAEAVAEFNNV